MLPDLPDPPPNPGVLVRLTGLVAIECESTGSHHLSSAQARVAFVRMALDGPGGTGRDQLADTIWPDGLPDTWASALRSVVSRVRSFVAGATTDDGVPVVAQGGRYLLRLPPGAVIDLERAQQEVAEAVAAHAEGASADARRLAESALTCLRRPLLPEHDGDWVNEVRARLAELLATALETASLAASAAGDGVAALRLADEVVRHAPLRESAYRARMTAHVAAGNCAEAMRTYHELRRTLADELGIDPSPESQAAYVALLGGPAPDDKEDPSQRGPRSPAPFVGRVGELAALARAWSRAERGTSHMVLVTGEAGVGRTRLVTEAAHRISLSGGLVAHGRCDRDPSVPYQPFAEAIGELLTAGLDDQDDARARAVLAALAADPTASEHPAAVVDLVVRVSRDRPVLLFLDELDLAGEDTLAVLRQVFRRRHEASLLVVATAGPAARRPDRLLAAVQAVDQDGWLYRLSLPGLTERDVAALVTEVVPEEFLAELPSTRRLVADTAGNAYLLLELLQWPCERDGDSGEELSPAIHDYAAAQLAWLAPEPRRLLRAAAAAGRVFELDLVVEVAELDSGRAMDALDLLLAAGILSEAGAARSGRYRFTHDVLRRSVYARLSTVRRRGLHSRLADVIESRRAGDLAGYTRALAHHRSAGATEGGDQRAVRWLWRAAARAGADGAAEDAVRLHRDALRHVPSADSRLHAEAITNLGLAQLAAGHPGCEQTLLDGALHAVHSERLPVAARAALGLADAVGTRPELRGEAAALIELLVQEVREHAPGPGAGGIDGVILGRLLARQVRLGSTVVAGSLADAALVALTRELGLLVGDMEAVAWRHTLAGELLAVATAVDDADARLVAAHHQAMAAELRGDLGARSDALAALVAAAHDAGRFGDALLLEHAVATAVTHGRFTDAALTARAAAVFTGHGDRAASPAAATAVDGSSAVSPAPGSLAERQLLVAGLLRTSLQPAAVRSPVTGLEAAERSLLALAGGARGGPHLTVRAFATGAEPLPPGDEWPHLMGVLALGAVELGDPMTADALRTRLARHAGLVCGVGYRTFVGPVSFHLGRLAVVAGDWDEAESQLTSALSWLTEREAWPWIALAKQALARAFAGRAGRGDRSSARALFAEANSALAGVGLRHLVTAPAER
ncbi:ATP-binding protein [Actinophytocola gossypii]|uniref:AAA family ATPase n=1 Tax=Actinophytocola gossypii TaxID=2812003 RepID=A0ABT2J286_9PSEU|nr:AAA family ATPase [Actinophytocola gossypii]MCT2581970.1 AAA family ATPase [Actinophytocola gossypii]